MRYKVRMQCLDCGAMRFVYPSELNRAARVRCLKCGGTTAVSRQGGGKLATGQEAARDQADRLRHKQSGG
jgi:ribosomal protein S27E